MYNRPYFVPNYIPTINPTMMRGIGPIRSLSASAPLINGTRATATAGKSLGLIGRLGNSLTTFRTINWSGLINGASKTLGVVNQAIPLVKQVGPMMTNMKSMLRIASVFKDETDKERRKSTINYQPNQPNKQNTYQKTSSISDKNTKNNQPPQKLNNNQTLLTKEDNSPTFFIPT